MKKKILILGSSSFSGASTVNYLLNKNSYQMDPGNSDESVHEVRLDIQEGADQRVRGRNTPSTGSPFLPTASVHSFR